MRAAARDELGRDHWVVTDREVIRVTGRSIAERILLSDAIGAVSQQAAGVTVRVHSRRDVDTHMLTSFRKPNAVTRALAERFAQPSASE